MNREPIGEGPIIKSVSIHTVLVLLVWWSSVAQVPAPDFVVFEIELISPPAAELGEQSLTPPEDLVIETPEELSLKKKSLLIEALTHKSANQKNNNEKLVIRYRKKI